MKIKNITLYKVEIPMITSFTTSFGTVTNKPTLILRAETNDGIVGWGEGAALPFPFYKPETTDTTILVARDYIAPLVLGQEIKDAEALMEILKPIKGNNFAKTAIETALWMIKSIESKKSLSQLLGGTQTKIPVGESIGIKETIENTLAEIQLRLDQGFRRIKIKIKPGWDLKLVQAIRREFGDIDLMIDANSAYSLEDVALLKKLDQYNLTMMEQPLADDDIIDHAVLQKQIKTPVCLDESIHSADDARRALSINACKIINIKPGRVGGILESKRIHGICQKNGVGVWCGGMLETGIGRAFNIAVASLPNYTYPSDMSPVEFFYSDDLVEDSFAVDKEGYVAVPTQPGLGYTVSESKIKKYTTSKITLS